LTGASVPFNKAMNVAGYCTNAGNSSIL
jgi:hypothetical protein